MTEATQNIIDTLKKAKEQYKKEGLYIVGIFGSYAQERYDDFSDIDIAYKIDHTVFSKYYKDGFSKILRVEEIKHTLENLFHKKIDFISLDSNNKNFVEHIKKEILYV